MAARLGDLLVAHGVLTPEQRDEILRVQTQSGRPFGVLAESLFGVAPGAVERAWAAQFETIAEWIDPRAAFVDPSAVALVTRRQAWQFGVLPMHFEGPDLAVCTTSTHLVRALRFCGWRVGKPCSIALAEPDALSEALQRHYPLAGLGPEALAAPHGRGG